MDGDLTALLGLTPGGRMWLAAATVLLLVEVVLSTIRRMLDGFSRKALLEGASEPERERLEDLLGRVDDYKSTLRAVDQGLRMGLIASLSFAFILRGPEPVEVGAEVASFLVFMIGLLALLVFFLELIPSVLARVRTEAALRSLLPFLDRLHRALAPLGRFYTSAVRVGARAVGGEEERSGAAAVEEEILSAVEEGEREGLLEEGDILMIESIIRFRDREVTEVMTPRTDMVCIDIEESLKRAVAMAIECGHSRIPVFRENKDNIAGILYVKDLLRFWGQPAGREAKLQDIVRQAHFVPESKKISELFHEFKSQRFHIAIILDEFGGTAGLITIEDIIEDIVGEIADEFEKPERPEFERLGEGLVEVDARLPIHDFNERMEVEEIPEDDGYETVGGFLFSTMGKIPRVGDVFRHGRLRFEVLEADERKINRLKVAVEALPGEAGEEAPASPVDARAEEAERARGRE